MNFFTDLLAIYLIISITITIVQLKKITVETLPDGTKVCREYCNNTSNLNDCKVIPCPDTNKSKLDRNCPVPDCLDEGVANYLWPVLEDPGAFYQCLAAGIWEPVKTSCSCETLFSYEKQLCVHPFEFKKECIGHVDRPEPTHCKPIE